MTTWIARRIQAANVFDASRYVPFLCDEQPIGWVRRDLSRHLSVYPDVLSVTADGVALCMGSGDSVARSEAMACVASGLASRGLLTQWRNELYEIGTEVFGAPAFTLERAAVRFFGFASRAVHLNGLVCKDIGWCMWVGRRSTHKAIDPGMYDNLMGGGVACDIDVEGTLIKEAWEEAGIPAELARQARRAGERFVRREVPDGLHAETLHMYDLALPVDFLPANQDGEVVEFRCLPLAQVALELASDASYTVDAALVAIECLQRNGVLP